MYSDFEKAAGNPQGAEFSTRLSEEMGYLSDVYSFTKMLKADDAFESEDKDEDEEENEDVEEEEVEDEDDENGSILSTLADDSNARRIEQMAKNAACCPSSACKMMR